ncbi:integrase core domain-containing protein [Serratia plymuthica]|uniref:integrase core domain-containing protein n=1 Tax=Serratia plymuthica TaxID=82996 RepID=UPI0036F3B18C
MRRYSEQIRAPKSIYFIFESWAYASRITLRLIKPNKPTQNGFIGSISDRFHDECINTSYAMFHGE